MYPFDSISCLSTFLNYSITQLIYVIIWKCKQAADLFKCINNTKIVIKIIMNLQFFSKNVNKQLKSADFFSEMSKFQKNSLKRILSFFIVMSKHTLLFVVHLPNMKYLIFPIFIFYYLLLYSNGKTSDGKFN